VFTPVPYAAEPVNISDFLRKRRIDLGLKQRDVAALLNVNVESIRNWEGGWRQPHIAELPKIIAFIGCCPYDLTLPLHKRIVLWRSYNGVTQKEMAEIIGIDPTTLARLEDGRIQKRSHYLRYIDRLKVSLLRMTDLWFRSV
jgi:transcriptional regulator with XRE-family HTH domain